ncbi:MAG: signal recognition particle protein [Bacteriovoracaceae bacterium]
MFDTLSDKFLDAFKHVQGKGKISESNIEEALKEVRTALLEADVNFKVVRNFINAVKEKALGEKVISGVNPDELFIKIVHDELANMMGGEHEPIDWKKKSPRVVLIVGLNGQGKTTFTGKLSHYLDKKENLNALMVPADTFRPAAKDQLITLAKQMGRPYFDSDLSGHPKDIALKAIEHAKAEGNDVVIIDTAGRLHVDEELMEQIHEVKKSIDGHNPEVLLVADAMTGQEAVNVAKSFHEKIGLTGVVLSKMDSDARGGAALSIKYVTEVPIRFISMGEKMKDLELFHPDRLAGRILDKGDVVTLVEKAQEEIDEKEAERMMKNLEKGKFTFDDFIKQMNMISNLGSMGSILKMIPGMGGALKQIGDLSSAEDEMKRMKIMISSMTKAERRDHELLNESRMERIAKGSGHTLKAVKDFVEKFRQMEKMMGSMMGMFKGGMPGMPGMPGMGDMPPGFNDNPGFRQQRQKKQKGKRKKGPWGGGFFS